MTQVSKPIPNPPSAGKKHSEGVMKWAPRPPNPNPPKNYRGTAVAKPISSEVWEWVLRSRTFDACSISWNMDLPEFPHFVAYAAYQGGLVL